MSSNEPINYHCRVCGFRHYSPPWGEDNDMPSFEICDCCGVEFGYGDNSPEAAKSYREKWLLEGAKWSWKKTKPDDWDLEEQLKHIPPGFE